MYIEYRPSLSLKEYVDCYWSSKVLAQDAPVQKIMPDGCVDIIFSFIGGDSSKTLGKVIPIIVGTMTHAFEPEQDRSITEMIGIRFRPAAITAFVKVPIYEFTNKGNDLDIRGTIFGKEFYEEMPYLKSTTQRIAHIEKHLIDRLGDIYQPDRRVLIATELITGSKGRKNLNDIINSVCLSERQFERCFKSAVGISPKTFSKIVQFNHSRHYLERHPDEGLFSVALNCGYYDHSHLTKDFLRFGDLLPRACVTDFSV